MLVPFLVGSGGRDGPQLRASGERRPAWPVVPAWALWLLTVLTLAAVPLLDRLLREAGRADVVQLTPGTAFPVVAMVSGATVGAVLASRRPRHPVGGAVLLGHRVHGDDLDRPAPAGDADRVAAVAALALAGQDPGRHRGAPGGGGDADQGALTRATRRSAAPSTCAATAASC